MAFYIFLFIITLLVLFFVVLCVGAIRAKNSAVKVSKMENMPEFNADYTKNLSELVQIKTVSHIDESLDDNLEFDKFIQKMRELYPTLFKQCSPVLFGNKAMLFHIKGEKSIAPTVLMAHYDVVPVSEDKWTNPPFCGKVIDGELWGRGTIDTKITLLGIAQACEALVKGGFKPKNDVYLAFGGNEEVAGHGAPDIIAHLKKNGVKPALVIDEGGAVVTNVIPGMKKPIAVIGIGEKGQMSAKLSISGDGGHASRPTTPSLLGKMCKAVTACEKHPFPGHVTEPVKGLFSSVAPHVGFGLRLVYGNIWAFGGILCALGQTMGSEFNALFRTTLAFTTAKASPQFNVMPTDVSVGVNIRSLNTDNVNSIKKRMEDIINDKDIKVTFDMAYEASTYAPASGEHWQKIVNAIGTTWPDAVAAPYLMLAASDSRHYNGYCDNIYKFSAFALSAEQRKLIHGNDERLPVGDIKKAVEFYTALTLQL